MSNSKIAPMRPSIAKILKRQIGGFVREYEREVKREAESAKKPEAKKPENTPQQGETPEHPE